MIMENQVLLMILDIFLKKENKGHMDMLMVMLSMKNIEMMLQWVLMDFLMVVLSMKNKTIALQQSN